MRKVLTAPLRRLRSVVYTGYFRALPLVPGSIAMLHTGRVGSTVVAKMLERHPALLWDGELLERYRKQKLSEQRIVRDPFAVLRWRMRNAGNRTYGFETKVHRLQHLGPEVLRLDTAEYVERLRELGFSRFIVLRRKNYLRQAVSAAVGQADERRHISKEEKGKIVRIDFDVERTPLMKSALPLLQRFEEFDALYDTLDRLLGDDEVLRLTYEDDIEQNPKVAYEKICSFLGLPSAPAEIELRKTNPYPLSDILLNYEEVAALLRGTEYEWMLERQSD